MLKQFTREEAIEKMMAGQKMRGSHWPKEQFASYDRSAQQNPFRLHIPNHEDVPLQGLWHNGKWEEYKELKKTVKMWQWVVRLRDGQIKMSEYFYVSEEDVRAKWLSVVGVIKKAEWTEIKVEK